MALVVKKKTGQNQQQLINEFRRLTYEDPGLEQVKQRLMMGYQKPSVLRKIKNTEQKKQNAKIRRRNRRLAGKTK